MAVALAEVVVAAAEVAEVEAAAEAVVVADLNAKNCAPKYQARCLNCPTQVGKVQTAGFLTYKFEDGLLAFRNQGQQRPFVKESLQIFQRQISHRTARFMGIASVVRC